MYRDDEKPPTRRSAGSTKELVTMTVRYNTLEMPLKGDDTNRVIAEVELTATSSTSVREPLDLVAVLDMGGNRISVPRKNMDEMKKAMQFVIMKLTPVDRLSIVTFKSLGATRMCPLLCMSEAGKKRAKAIINGLAPEARSMGSTIAAVETGVAVVDGRVHTTGRTANIFLMSWNELGGQGGYNLEKLVNVPIYTFVFGKNPDILQYSSLETLAKWSLGGTFSFVPEGASLTAAISQLLGGLLTVVAQNVEFILTPARDHPRDLREAVVGYTYTCRYKKIEDEATGITRVRFGNLFSGESRKIVVSMTLLDSTAAAATARYDAELAYARCSYTAQGSVGGHQAPHVLQTKRMANPAAAHSTLHEQVWAPYKYAEAISSAAVSASLGEPDKAKYKLVNAQNALADVLASAESHETISMRRAELRRMLQFVGYSKKLFKEKGKPYAYACVSSHHRRRFAARGDDIDTLRFYATPHMNTYLQQARQFDRDPSMQLPTADDDAAKENAAGIKS